MTKVKHKNPEFGIALVAICVGVVLLFSISAAVVPEMGLLKENIMVEVEGAIIHYQRQSFWNESEFSAILENENDFKSTLLEKFADSLSRYGERGEYAVDADVEFDEARKATVLKCDVHGAITKSDDSYRATFKWLLTPLGLDFIDNKFEESEKGLSWKGNISCIPTTITLKLPPQESVYAAWQHPVGHCHAHVWWIMPVSSPPLTPTPSGFEAVLAITGLLVVTYLVLRRRGSEKQS